MKLITKFAFALLICVVTMQSCTKEKEGYVGDYPDKAKVVFINVAPNGATVAAEAVRPIAIAPYFNGVNFFNSPINMPWSSGYQLVEPGTLSLRLDTAFSTPQIPNRPAATVKTYNLNVQANSYYSFYAVGTTQNVDSFFVKDDLTLPGAGKTKVRFYNFSPDAGPIDIVNEVTKEVLVANLTYLERRAYVVIPSNIEMSMRVYQAGTAVPLSTPLINTKSNMAINGNSVYTVFVSGYKPRTAAGSLPIASGQDLRINYHANYYSY